VWDRARLHCENIAPRQALEAQGVGVHVGEWGAYRFTPHTVALRRMQTNLELWRDAGWGRAIWDFRGDVGPLDSKRAAVRYEPLEGHPLDRAMLELIGANCPPPNGAEKKGAGRIRRPVGKRKRQGLTSATRRRSARGGLRPSG